MTKVKIIYTKSKLRFALFSWLVRLFTWRKYSHVALEVTIPKFNPMIYQASQSMTHLMSEEIFKKRHTIVKTHELLVPTNLYHNMITNMSNQLGQPYAMLQNIGIGLAIILSWIGIKIKNPWSGGLNCSELIYTELLVPMLGKEATKDPQLVTPDEIDEIVEEKCQKNLLKTY
jgi:hypothetical protein